MDSSMAKLQPDFEALSTAEKILHVQDLWDRIAAGPEAVELTEAQAADLDRRLEEHRSNPERGSSWEEVRDRVRSGQ
jgi:putative addiction module component (TIGR02574 family)